jgi:hypothetical protein
LINRRKEAKGKPSMLIDKTSGWEANKREIASLLQHLSKRIEPSTTVFGKNV